VITVNGSGNRFGRPRRAEGSQANPRSPYPHPDAQRATRRMTFEELRSLVLEVIESEPRLRAETEDDAVNEFDSQLTTFRPTKPRTSTLDDLIAWLRTAPAPAPQAQPVTPKTRRRV